MLEADHKEKKTHRKMAISLLVGSNRSWAFVLRELKKCVVRCANCHRRRTAVQLGYGKVKWKETQISYTLSESVSKRMKKSKSLV